MPVSKENRLRYPPTWKRISAEVRARAGDACEGSPRYPECRARNGAPHPVTGSRVVLTVGHLNHVPEDCRLENLRCWCNRCHNNYDAPMRAKHRRETRRRAVERWQPPLFAMSGEESDERKDRADTG
jgi:hypothetical protein